MAATNTPKTLPSPRLIRTAHNAAGVSIIASDETVPGFFPFGPQASAFRVFDVRAAVPVSNTDPQPAAASAQQLPRCPPGGIILATTDIPGGGRYATPMHRTVSLDYGVVLSGEIVIELDGGEERTVKAGEVVMQGGVNHRWVNRAEEPCRILCVMIGADKIVLEGGEVLEETAIGKK